MITAIMVDIRPDKVRIMAHRTDTSTDTIIIMLDTILPGTMAALYNTTQSSRAGTVKLYSFRIS